MGFGKLLWEPDPAKARKTNMVAFEKWLEKRGMSFEGYNDVWRWSVEDIEGFWGALWKYFNVADEDYVVLRERTMPGAKWFDGSELNFAEHIFRGRQEGDALVCVGERGKEKPVSWPELERRTAALGETLRSLGVASGDRVAGILPNGPEAVVALLACASIGAIWSGCSPDFGAPAIIDRFGQIGPKVLIATEGYSYGGKWFDRRDAVRSVVESCGTIQRVIEAPGEKLGLGVEGAVQWGDATRARGKPAYELVPFEHPLWILYSSGTTGLPKPIVHSHGGILVELLKVLSLHNDIRPGDRFFWFTTTGWMMWNYLVGGLLHGATLVLYAGSPTYPGPERLWDLAEKNKVSFLGTSAAFLSGAAKSGSEPGSTHDLTKLRGIGSTGSPLPPEAFEWVYSKVKGDVWLSSVSGGTDVCTGFVGGTPTLPVHSGEIQCRYLGAKVESFDEEGKPVVGKVGELVVTEPMPSMPVFLWGDPDGSRYRESYFDMYPGVWRHGDWIKITPKGTCIIYGRSDATLKRQGVRMGTSEIYRVVEGIPEVADSVAVDLGDPSSSQGLMLFVSLKPGAVLDEALVERIRSKVKSDLSPRHVPDRVVQVPAVPRTLNGKKVEVPLKRILLGTDPDKAMNRGSLSDPESIEFFVKMSEASRKH